MDNSTETKPEFFKNWQINLSDLEAIHNSGIKFTLLGRDEKGEIEVKFSAPKSWVSEQRQKFPEKRIEDTLYTLKHEFKEIMRDVPIPEPVKPLELLAKIKQQRMSKNA